MSVNLTTVERVKALGASKGGAITSNPDAYLETLIAAYSAVFERHLGRSVEEMERTETYTVGPSQNEVALRAYPVSAIEGVWNDPGREYGDASEVTAYYLDSDLGIIHFDYYLAQGLGALRVTYTGGMAPDGTDPTGNFISLFPDVSHAMDLQVWHAWSRSLTPGSSAAGVGGGSVSYTGQLDLLDAVKSILRPHRRFSL